MKCYVGRTLVALAAPGGGWGDVHDIPSDGGCRHDDGPGGCTAVSHLDELQPPEGYTTIYVNVGTVRYADVTTAHQKTVNTKHAGNANAEGRIGLPYAKKETCRDEHACH